MILRGNTKFDQRRCLEMALIHDIGEGLVGDFTPHCKIS
jgi:5'-deoxynucleotidase YfbR-like HD superfamily hydrolase